jgi:dienelactone hydrolase
VAAARVAFAALLIVGSLLAGPAEAATYDWDKDADHRFRMWIDDDQPVVYGFYVVYNSSGEDARIQAERQVHQYFARSFGFGLIGTDITNPGDPGALIEAVAAFAQMSGHPEIANAVFVVEGASLGGYLAMEAAAAFPLRTVAYLSGASTQLVNVDGNAAFYRVPGLFYMGSEDEASSSAAREAALRALRADGAQIGFWMQWGFGHGVFWGTRVGWNFLEDAVLLRYPSDQSPVDGTVELIDIPDDYGWLADPETWDSTLTEVYPYGDYPGDPSTGFWLPTNDMAYIYRPHATMDAPLSFVVPQDPSYTLVAQIDDVEDLEVDPGSFGGVVSVEFFNGATSLGVDTSPPYTAQWTVTEPGAHAIHAVATNGSGDRAGGFIAAYVVPGDGVPGGGGLEDPSNRPDAGPAAGGDGGPVNPGQDAGIDEGEAGGCCQSSQGSPTSSLVLLALVAVALWRSRRTTPTRSR